MKRRMCAADRVALEATARPIVTLYVARSTDASLVRRSAQAMTRIVAEMMQLGCTVQASPSESVRLSPTQQWLFAVESVMRQVDRDADGAPASAVLVLRLTRAQKTEASSFGRIAQDINTVVAGRSGVVITTEEAEGLYRAALQRFVELLAERNIGRDVAMTTAVAAPPQLDPAQVKPLINVGRQFERLARQVRQRRARRHVTIISASDAAVLYRAAR